MRTILGILLAASMACAPTETPPGAAAPPVQATRQAQLPDDLVDRVWKVESSTSVAVGTLYAFLSDGSLVVTSRNATPMVGQWRFEDGALTMVEEGQSYPTDVVELTSDTLAIRSHNPGSPVEIRLRLAHGR